MRKAAIVIPTYNERKNIPTLLEQIEEITRTNPRWETHVVIVDSSSPDGTGGEVDALKSRYPHLHLLTTEKEGLGKAYIRGFSYAMEKINPFLLFEMDADLSHNPSLIPAFFSAVEKGADFVVGSRYMKGGSIPADWGLHRKFLSVLGNLTVRLGFMRLSIKDWTSGYRAIKTWVVKDALSHVQKYSGYVFQVALLDFAVNKHAVIAEVPLAFKDRREGVSKINAVQYMTQTLWYVFSHSAFIKYVIVGLTGFLVDFAFAYLFINGFHIAKTVANGMSAEVAIIGNFLLNNFWSFRHKKITGGISAYLKAFLTFNLVSLGSVLISMGGMWVALKLFGDTTLSVGGIRFGAWILYKVLITGFLIIPYSYILYNKVVWKK